MSSSSSILRRQGISVQNLSAVRMTAQTFIVQSKKNAQQEMKAGAICWRYIIFYTEICLYIFANVKIVCMCACVCAVKKVVDQ